jgi:flavin reductase (DIM6/NTAB) family NADH-FMN oxidoreductase RutF
MATRDLLSTSTGVGNTEFRRAMGCFATGVAVVTTLDDAAPRGLTVNSITSVSLNPPLILVCVDHTSESYNGFLTSRVFAVNFLALDQRDVAQYFARKAADKFSGISYETGITGAPLLAGIVAYMECMLEAQYPGGDHTIFVGRVVASHIYGGEPLVFFRGKYARLERMPLPITYLYGG